ncbi:hypothetical protein BJF93_18910 [Xaviernesmea oryzae]|uniref:DUF1800 family protein n=1 Tax=Xaviernesmea oryzae TaxID=464029 RepID=A0A1Q9B182_9HYPH|nr:DUF1800 family protein [Xaviernesmea oryzae]OLP61771.1 hypothetical protein BJF93_18910 [Xaviernesmea oryzae]SEL77869.1 Uncharacterized conserved protein, DUF1800 family [Xaviernesmea oryzae]
MDNSKDMDAALALWRFGLGPQAGSIAALGDGARDLLREEVAERAVPVPSGARLHSTAALLEELRLFQQAEKAERERPPSPAAAAGQPGQAASLPASDTAKAKVQPVSADPAMAPAAMAGKSAQPDGMDPKPRMQTPKPPEMAKRRYLPQEILIAEAEARFNGTLHTPLIGFGERLAQFWTNHFAVATSKGGEVHIVAGAFEREAIRPHLFGPFEEMLQAVETHPAMLAFLDNQQSVGPASPVGQKGKQGLNENLAREIMELHTLGVDGGYHQADVTALARIITGWTVARSEKQPENVRGRFFFRPEAHEPGDQTVMGITYAAGGAEEGRAVLSDLARYPATAHHLAVKLARHFVADDPPAALVSRLASAYTRSKGNLSAVYLALIEAPEAWSPELGKIRPPLDYVGLMLRTTGLKPKPEQVLQVMKALGQPYWDPSGPNGFSDRSDGWASPEGLATRLDAASLFAGQVTGDLDPRAFVADRLGPLLSPQTLQTVSRAETRAQGLTLAFLSPEFQRR